MTNVLRSMPRTCLPYMFFIRITSKRLHSVSSASDSSGNRKSILSQKLACDFSESRDTPATTAPALRNFAYRSRNSMPSVVQPGVLSFG
jgi:hypothetical protein